MAIPFLDTLSHSDKQQIASIRAFKGYSLFSLIMFGLISTISIFVVISALFNSQQHSTLTSGSNSTNWSEDFNYKQAYYSDWLASSLGQSSKHFYDTLATQVNVSAHWMIDSGEKSELSFGSSILLSLHLGLLRAFFVLIAWWRPWLLVVLLGLVWGGRSWRVHKESDVLGQCGNDRLYYSGIRAQLDKVTPTGAPDKLVSGLACIDRTSNAEARYSELGKTLERFAAQNQTNLELTAILLKHAEIPPYIAQRGEELLLDKAFSGDKLAGNTHQLMQVILDLHALYADRFKLQKTFEFQLESVAIGAQTAVVSGAGAKLGTLNSKQYAELLKVALHRVLTPSMRYEIAQLTAKEIACAVLAHESGKVMGFGREGDRWVMRSNFIPLCARSVLHSIPQYAMEFSGVARDTIRRAIIYGSRRSLLAPVTLASDLSPAARALRQWVELLVACPHEIESAADDAELYALVSEANRAWSQVLMDGVMTSNPEIISGSCSFGHMFFMPLQKIVNIMRHLVTPQAVIRLEQLVHRISKRQELSSLLQRADGSGKSGVPAYEKIPAPISDETIFRLASDHEVKAEDLKFWSTMRVVLGMNGWLGRRVGENTVSENSIIFLVCKGAPDSYSRNSLGLSTIASMVPLRSTRIEDRLGETWGTRMQQLRFVRMSESREGVDRLLSGHDDAAAEELSESDSQ